MKVLNGLLVIVSLVGLLGAVGCSTDKVKNQAKQKASEYWLDKAYPGKAYDVQVVEAEEAGDGLYRVKGLVDGEERVGTYSPETGMFNEGYYGLSKERNKRIAELEQEVKYWKEKSESLEKEIYKYKVQMKMGKTAKKKVVETTEDESETE